MSDVVEALAAGWSSVAGHLWQSTLLLLPLGALALALRRAPARLRALAWGAALAKLLLPLGLAASLLGVAASREPSPEPAPLPLFVVTEALVAGGSALPARASAWPVVLTVLWLAGAGLLLARWIRSSRRVPARALGTLPAETSARLREALALARVDESDVRLVGGSSTPCVVGVVRPVILVPAEIVATLDARELAALLLHEDGHRLRREPLREAFRRAVSLAFFFYPPLWVILRGLRASAELACDEHAVRRGASPDDLARALARCVRAGAMPGPLAAAASGRSRSLLAERLSRLDDPRRARPMPLHRVAAAAAVLIAAAAVLAPAPRAGGPVLSSLSVPPLDLDARALGVPEGGEVIVNVGVEVDASGRVTGVTFVHVKSDVPADQVELLEKAAKAVLENARFAAGELGESEATVELVWQVGTSARLGAGDADIEPTPEGTRAIVRAPGRRAPVPEHLRLTEGMTPPVLVESVQPAFPAEAAGVQGAVAVEAIIGADGTVGSVRVLKEIDGVPALTKATLDAVRQWKYTPAMRDGQPVAVSLVINMKFTHGPAAAGSGAR